MQDIIFKKNDTKNIHVTGTAHITSKITTDVIPIELCMTISEFITVPRVSETNPPTTGIACETVYFIPLYITLSEVYDAICIILRALIKRVDDIPVTQLIMDIILPLVFLKSICELIPESIVSMTDKVTMGKRKFTKIL